MKAYTLMEGLFARGISIIFVALFIVGCSANSSDRSRTERARHLLDKRQYADAISIFEKEYAAHPEDKKTAVLLAQAHLGAAGVELFEFISGVFGAQGPRDHLDLVVNPKCEENEITKIQGFDFRCLALRLLSRLPDADNAHVERAQTILRQAFPKPSKTPIDVNFLAAFVELGSGFSRLKVLLKKTLLLEIQTNASVAPSTLPFVVVIHHFKRLIVEFLQGISRAKYSYGKISKYVLQYEGKPLIKIGENTLVFSEDLNISTLVRFAISVLHEKSESVDRQLSFIVAQNVNSFGHGIITVLQSVDGVYFQGEGRSDLMITFRFERAINKVLEKFAAASNDAATKIDVFDLVWINPPAILKTLFSAAQKSWENETADPLKEYFISTKDRWNEFNRLMNAWEEWMNEKLSTEQHDQMIAYLLDVQSRHKQIFKVPTNLTENQIKVWHSQLVGKLTEEMTNILMGRVQSIPTLTLENASEGLFLVEKSKTWANENLWPL